MNNLVLTVGVPRTGKSTWAKAQGVPVVNPDSIRLCLHGKTFLPNAEKFVWAIADIMVRSLFVSGHTTVILDATNVTRQRRREWLNTAWETRYRVFQMPRAELMRRAFESGRDDLMPVIERMLAEFEPLDSLEAKYEVFDNI